MQKLFEKSKIYSLIDVQPAHMKYFSPNPSPICKLRFDLTFRTRSKGKFLALAILPLMAAPLSAAIVNLTNSTILGNAQSTLTSGSTTFVGGMINGALYRRPVSADDSGSGSGVFRDLYRVDTNSGPESGYNRDGVMNSSVPNGFDPVITVGDLVEDSTGTAYVFVVDTNEAGSAAEKFISFDDFKIYVAGTGDPSSLPQSLTAMGSEFGTPVYDMRASGLDNHVLLDYSLFSGSGQMDMFVFIPKALFGNAAANQMVYVYSEFGSYAAAGFDPSAGPEQVSLPGKSITGTVDPLIQAVPEPGMVSLLLSVGLLVLRRRR